MQNIRRRRRAGAAWCSRRLRRTRPAAGPGLRLGIYEREIRFYRELAPRLGGPLAAMPRRRLRAGGGWFTLLLEDVGAGRAGRPDRRVHASTQARVAVHELARATRTGVRKPRAERDAMAQPAKPARSGGHGAAARHVPGALRRPCQPRAPGRVPAVRRQPGRLDRRPATAARPGPRRLSPRQHDVRRRGSATPLRGGRLADGRLGIGDDRRVLLPRRLAEARGPPGARTRRSSREYFEQLAGPRCSGTRAGKSAGLATAARASSDC